MKYLCFLLICIGCNSFAQDSWDDFTGEERAFFYHQSRRVNLLKPELFHLFEFTDSIPYINDTLPDYRYVEAQIVNDPSLLILHHDEMGRKSAGVLSDLSLRFALWELDKVLQFRNSTAESDKPLKVKLKVFEKYVLEAAPQSAIKTLNNGTYKLAKNVQGYYAPSLTVADKLAAILNSGYERLDQMLILNAVMKGQETYVNVRSREIFSALGGKEEKLESYLSAVGDGANWAEIVGGFNTPYTIGLPDEKGLFRFTIEEKLDDETEKKDLSVVEIGRRQFTTSSNEETVVHVDVFGYHPQRQTTIAIQKGGKSYVLYGKNEHRLVSPDSTYGEGTTYWRLMENLEFYHIANLKEDLYGKKGYEYQIDLFEKRIEGTLLDIKETEYRLDKLRHTPEGKPKMKKKKIKKKNLGYSDQDGGGHPTSAMSKLDKKKAKEQYRLVQLNGQLSGQKGALKQLKEDMEKAYEYLIKYEAKLDFMKKNIGYIIMEFEKENHIYTFKDGATFNYLTQDFVFPKDRSEEVFQIYHISFGEKVFSDKIDENFAHINVSKRLKNNEFTLKRTARDDGQNNLGESDSIQIMELFHHLAKKNIKAAVTLNAGGAVGKEGETYYRDSAVFIQAYDKEQMANNGVAIFKSTLNATMELSVTVFDDPMIPANFELYKPAYDKLKSKYSNLSEVDFYTGMRAKKAAEDWIALLKELVPKWIENSTDQKRIMSKLKKLKPGKVYFVGERKFGKVPKFAS